jgi:hypothetical protein
LPGTPWVNCCHKHGYSTPNKVQRYSSLFKHDFFFQVLLWYIYIYTYIYIYMRFWDFKLKRQKNLGIPVTTILHVESPRKRWPAMV